VTLGATLEVRRPSDGDHAEHERARPATQHEPLPWIQAAPGAPYFVDDHGRDFTPIGQNDSISWVELKGLFRRADLGAVERHLAWLRDHGVTVLRLMLEYAERRSHYFERPAGCFNPVVVQVWDDLFAICERVGMRILLTPVDTFWTWIRWEHHPYNQANGGPLDSPSRLLLCPATRELVKARLRFAAGRWGGSGVLFAWDLWNEIHPAQAEGSADCFGEFIAELSAAVRDVELRRFGRTHPQTVSLFGPELEASPHLDLASPAFRHPSLDFANLHIYGSGPVDNPANTVDAALAMGRIVREALAEIHDGRPFFDSEHGPIHAFKDRKRTLPEPFDDEYFRHMQWAHFASGGAGGGMRWPNRNPHVLTPGMRRAQRALAGFLPLVAWSRFRRRNLNQEIVVSNRLVSGFACGDDDQAVVWLLRRGPRDKAGRLSPAGAPVRTLVRIPGLKAGRYRVTAWDTVEGGAVKVEERDCAGGKLDLDPPAFGADLALAVRRSGPGG
jgi:mannan endo-1,4-beta-mannosidase